MTVATLPSASHQATVLRTENPQFFLPVRKTSPKVEADGKEPREEEFRARWWRAEEWDAR